MSYRVFEQCALATVSSVLAVVSMAVEDDVDGAMPIERNTTTLGKDDTSRTRQKALLLLTMDGK